MKLAKLLISEMAQSRGGYGAPAPIYTLDASNKDANDNGDEYHVKTDKLESSNENLEDEEVEDLKRSDRLTKPSSCLLSPFVVLNKHIYACMIDLYNSKQKTDRWCIFPPHFQWALFNSRRKNKYTYYFDGSLEPVPKMNQVDEVYVPLNVKNKHWFLGVFDLHKKALTIYDSLMDWPTIDKDRTEIICHINFAFDLWLRLNGYYDEKLWSLSFPFTVIYPDNVPQQSEDLGDCGVWVCIYMERLINRQPIFNLREDAAETAMQMRQRLAIKLYDSILADDFDMASTSKTMVENANKELFPD